MRLNDQAARAAKSGTLWDSDLKGFGLRVGKQSKTFIVDIGRGRRKKLGRYPLMSLAVARDAAKKILAEKALGSIVPKHTAFEDARKEFLEDCAKRLRPSTLAQYEWHLNRLPFKRKSIGDITGRDLLKVLKEQTPSNREHLHRISRTFFTYCYKSHLIERSPMERLEAPPNGKPRDRVLTDTELAKVYQKATKGSTGLHRLIWLLIRTGQRVGETRRLKTQFMTPTSITFPGEITKNGKTHYFPISKETFDTIQSWPRFNDYIFPASRTHVRGKAVEVMSVTGIKDFQKGTIYIVTPRQNSDICL